MSLRKHAWMVRLAGREIRANPKFSVFFVLNLLLGLTGLIALDAFKTSFEASMSGRSRELLGADLSISARRPLTEAELRDVRRELGAGVSETHAIELYTMLRAKNVTRLAELRAVSEGFPFYGKIVLADGRRTDSEGVQELTSSPSIWLSPELALQLGVGVGDTLGVGRIDYRVSGIVADDSSSSWRGFSLASPAWVGLPKLAPTGLVGTGSTVSYRVLYRLPENLNAEEARTRIQERIADPGVRIRSHQRASDQVGRMIDYVNDYLGLVSLVALFFAALGAAYLFRSFLTRRYTEIAILVTLGVPNRQASAVFCLQLATLGFVAALGAIGATALLLPAMSAFMAQFLSIPVSPALSLSAVALALCLGTVGSVLIAIPLLSKAEHLKPSQLFSEEAQPVPAVFDRRKVLPALLLGFAFWGLACWQARSWIVGSLFVVGFSIAAAVLAAIALGLLAFLRRWSTHGFSLKTRLAIRSVARAKLSSFSLFLALGLGTLLVSLIPQLQGIIRAEIEMPSVNARPSLFLFDIQDEQAKPLVDWLKKSRSLELTQLSPMVRARFQAVNGKAFERDDKEFSAATREEEQSARSKNRMFNLNFRDHLADSESLVAGREFSGRFDPAQQKHPEVTVETRFADRLGLKLGDVVTFDVEGVEVSGQIVGVRRVNWMSFQPNFFITFQPGVLEEAPKTWLGSLAGLDAKGKNEVQNELTAQFTNVSVIDVEGAISKVLVVLEQVGIAIRVMALLTLIAGFAVLFSVANQQANSRRRETSLLKVLGARFEDVEGIFVREILWISGAAALAGGILSLLFSYALTEVVFDLPWRPNLWIFVGALFAVPVLAVLIARVSARRALGVKPILLLQEAPE